jgi:hypothetical protein
MQGSMQTARLSERTAFLGQVDVVPHTGNRRLTAWGQDVSETGMFLQTTQAMAVGDALSLRFSVDGIEVHIRAAEVVWSRKFEPINVDGKLPGVGIRFVSIDPPARAALRRLVQGGLAAEASHHASADSMLPAPTTTLPPLSASIIESAGGRDLEDTQDLLPPAATRPTPVGGVTFSMLPFRSLDMSLPPDEPNLSAESRVFGGVPAAPRPVTMLPRPRTRPPTSTPTLTMTTEPRRSSLAPTSTPPRGERSIAHTQPLFTLPPIDVVEQLEQSMLPQAAANDDAINVSAVNTVSADEDLFVGWQFALKPAAPSTSAEPDDGRLDVDAIVMRAMHARFDDEGPVIDNPSILESSTMPPHGAAEDSGSYSLGELPSSSQPPTMGAQASLRGLDEGMAIRHLPLAQERRDARSPVARDAPRRRGSWGVAAAVLVAGCAAGALVGLGNGASDATQVASVTVVPVVPVVPPTPAAAAPIVAVPLSVAQAERELREPAIAAAPVPVAVAVVAKSEAKVEVEVEVEAKVDTKIDTKIDTNIDAKVDAKVAAKVETKKVETRKGETKVAEAVLTSARATTATAKPGRVEVKLPEGGRIVKVFSLGAPARVVVDLEGATLPSSPLTVGQGGAEQVRFGRPDAGTQRVVVVLSSDQKPDAVDARLDGDRLIASWQF